VVLSVSRRAVLRRTALSGIFPSPAAMGAAAGAGAGAGCDAGAAAVIADRTSARTMRPPGPVPVTVDRSMPCSRANARARGICAPPPVRRCGSRRCFRRWYALGRFCLRRGSGTDGPGAVADHCDRLADRHSSARGDEVAFQHAVGVRLEFHHGLVGLDLGEDVAAMHRVAFALPPLAEHG
jgi:hypothetical protein